MSAQRPQPHSELHPLSIIRMIWKRKLITTLTWLIGSAIAITIVWMLPPIYKSEALILVDSQKIPERFVSSTVSTDIQDRIATITQEILSSSQLKKIIDDYGLYKAIKAKSTEEEILDKMRKDITIQMEKGWTQNRPGAFRVGYQGPDPQIVAQVANRLANLCIEENLRVREVQAEGTSEFMDTQLVEAQRRLDQLEAAVSEYKVKHNGELPQQESAISSELTREDQALIANRDAIRRAEESKAILSTTLGIAEGAVAALSQAQPEQGNGPAVAISKGVVGDQPMSEAHRRVLLFRAKLQSLKDLGYTDRHPDVVEAREQLEAASIEETKENSESQKKPAAPVASAQPDSAKHDGGKQDVPAPPVPTTHTAAARRPNRELLAAQERLAAIKTQLEALDRDIQDRTAEQKKIQQNISLLETRLSGLPVREQEMAGLTRDYEISKATYRTLLDKKYSAAMANDMERRQKSERFTLLDPPRVPEKPAMPNRPLFGSLGSAVALVLGLVIGLALEFRKSCVLGEWELPKGTVVLSRIPDIEIAAIRLAAPSSPKRWLRRWAVGLASVFLVAVIATGFYLVRSRF
jgi:uncharacterized protein involved in exopolysaccharide biosynthesis